MPHSLRTLSIRLMLTGKVLAEKYRKQTVELHHYAVFSTLCSSKWLIVYENKRFSFISPCVTEEHTYLCV
jgi:hypothetical protein